MGSMNVLILFSAALFSGSALLLLFINSVVPNPYMDEIFHADQVKRYCQGRFTEWNDKITTPPALYFVTYGIWRIVNASVAMFSNPAIVFDCNYVTSLRWVNLIFLLILYLVICDILNVQWTRQSTAYSRRWNAIIVCATALNLCCFPILYFTAFLYYTDILSTLAVLGSYSSYLRGHRLLSASFGLVSCAVRQTNIVWIAFFGYLAAVDALIEVFRSREKKVSNIRSEEPRMRITDRSTSRNCSRNGSELALIINGVKELVKESDWWGIWEMALQIVLGTWMYVTVGLLFIACVVWNGGLALGDRSAHQACLHLVQFFYYSLVTCGFGAAGILTKRNIGTVLNFWHRNRLSAALITSIILVVIYGFTLDHPYLLADNRHYTFYIWRRWFMRHVALKYVLAPIYVCSFIALFRSLADTQNGLWITGYFGVVFLVTVPNRLLEFRYFILPYLFWRLHQPPFSKRQLCLEFLFFFIINALSFVLFLFKPFKWNNSEEWQRFMW